FHQRDHGYLFFQVSSSKKAVAGVASTAAFFLCEGLLGRHFDVVPNGVAEPQPGDLFLFPLTSGGPGWWGAHAGVYCGDGEIIHLEGHLLHTTGTSGTSPTGIVAKHGKSYLLRTRGPAKVLRMKGGLDAAALQWRVQAAMDMVLEYDAVTCNCIHFALALLGLGQLTGDMVSVIALRNGGPQYSPQQSLIRAVFSPRCSQHCSEGGGDVTWGACRPGASFLHYWSDEGYKIKDLGIKM
ncbi:hypothetical protein ASZ78_016108, partial [Callipepla squamata]